MLSIFSALRLFMPTGFSVGMDSAHYVRKYSYSGKETAYLFYHFAIGDLKADATHPYNKLDLIYGQDALQRAIWMLEDELAKDDSNKFYALVKDMNLTDIGAVRVINPVDENYSSTDPRYYKQSILVLTPEPGTILILGLGLAGLAAIRRKI